MTDLNAAVTLITESQQLLDRAKGLLASAPTTRIVRAGEALQPVLDQGGAIELEAATWEGSYVARSGTVLTGRLGTKLHGSTGPALAVLPGSRDVSVSTLELASGHTEVCRIGENSEAQRTIADMPTGILLSQVRIPNHRGKHAFSIHGAVTLRQCEALECYDPGKSDSQSGYFGNTAGPIVIRGGRYSAASEVLLFGGGVTWIPNVVPANILIEGVELSRPPEWQGNLAIGPVKNLLEVKNGAHGIVRNCHLHHCWHDGQDGYAIVLTPALDGDRVNPPLQSGTVEDWLFEDLNIHDVASAFQIMGRAYTSYTPTATTDIVVRRLTLRTNAVKYGGESPSLHGRLATITNEPGDLIFMDCPTVTDGSSLILYDPGDVLDPATKQLRKGGKIRSLTMTGCRANLGEFGLMLGGNTMARNWQASVESLTIKNNVFGGGPLPDFPNNQYVPAFTQ